MRGHRMLIGCGLAAALATAPATARAASATLVARDLPLGGARTTAAAQAPARFDLVGFHWQGRGTVLFRTRGLGGRWSSWRSVEADEHVSPQVEGRSTRGWQLGEPYWTGPSDRVEYRASSGVRRLRAYYVWSPVRAVPARTLSMAGSPAIVPRASWGADEEARRAPPRYASAIHFAVIHHTAGSNAYSEAAVPAIVRGIELYHIRANGWNDIGYNFLVDKYGRIFEGRYGGIARNVIGAHSEGFNTGSVGIAVIGTYQSRPISAAARAALVKLLAWRLDVAHVDPLSTLTWPSGGNPRYPAGAPVVLRAISGHRDTGYTDCPGNALYAQLNSIAASVAATGLPKLYSPTVRGRLGGPISFTARLTSPLAWTITVLSRSGKRVAGGSGSGRTIDWTWNSAGAHDSGYRWTMEAGARVRPAAGLIGVSTNPPPPPPKPPPPKPPPGPLLGALALSATTLSPNGDGWADDATVDYTLGADAFVTATVQDSSGATVATLFASQRLSAGAQSFVWAPDALSDGAYRLVLTARQVSNGTVASASAGVLVDRTLSSFTGAPSFFSPNGDGVQDTVALSFALTQAAQVTVTILQGTTPVATLFSGQLQAGPQQLTWDGKGPSGPLPDGTYVAQITVTDPVGEVFQSATIALDTTPPALSVVDGPSITLSLSEPARVTVTIDGQPTVVDEPAGQFQVAHAAPPSSFTAAATDLAGNTSATVSWP